LRIAAPKPNGIRHAACRCDLAFIGKLPCENGCWDWEKVPGIARPLIQYIRNQG
jgi:hypothetical protein